jgi:hypothetical protein
MYGYSEPAYLESEVTVGLQRDDGFVPILNEGREVAYIAPSQMMALVKELEDTAYRLGKLTDARYQEIVKRRRVDPLKQLKDQLGGHL